MKYSKYTLLKSNDQYSGYFRILACLSEYNTYQVIYYNKIFSKYMFLNKYLVESDIFYEV